MLVSALLCPAFLSSQLRAITSHFLRGSLDDFREIKATDNKIWTFTPSKAKSIGLQLYQIMISFIPVEKASQITRRPVSKNFSTQADCKVFSFFESVEGLIFSCFVKARCKALALFSSIVVTHNNMFSSREQTRGDTVLFCISLKRLPCYTRP